MRPISGIEAALVAHFPSSTIPYVLLLYKIPLSFCMCSLHVCNPGFLWVAMVMKINNYRYGVLYAPINVNPHLPQ